MPDNCVYTFKNNTLLIRDQYCSTKLQWGEKPMAMEQLGAGAWKEGSTQHRVLTPKHIDAAANREAIDAFSALIPKKIQRTVIPFADHQWMMLQLLARNPYSADLAKANLLLTYCLANNEQFRHAHRQQVIWEQANMYVRRKQKLILQWLGFPSSGIIVKLMKKIDCTEMSIRLLRLFRSALQQENPTVRLLSHHQSISAGMLALLRPPIAPFITPELVADMADNPQDHTTPHISEQLNSISLGAHRVQGRRPIPTLRSVKEVEDYYEWQRIDTEALLEELRKLEFEKEELLGDPPIAGTDDIVPVDTKVLLLTEAKQMKNCVASYYHKIKREEVYIYKVQSPERATLSIAPNFDGSWRIQELKLKCNRSPSDQTISTINAWIRNATKERY